MTENEMLEIYEAQRNHLFARLTEEMKLWSIAMGKDDKEVAAIHDNKARAIRATLTKIYGINF